jgi:hypothetical protein
MYFPSGSALSAIIIACAFGALRAPAGPSSLSARMSDLQLPPPSGRVADGRRDGAALIARAVEGAGGAAVIDRIRSLRVETLGKRRLPSGEVLEIAAASSLLFPDKYLHEVTLPVGKVTTLISGANGYLISAGETTPLPEHEKFNIEDRILRLPVVLLRKRHDPFFEAVAEQDGELHGRRVNRVLIRIGAKQTQVALDSETGRVVQVRYRERTIKGETGSEIVSTYGDYRVVKGLAYPFAVSVTVEGRPEFTSQTSVLLVDEKVTPEMFQPPGGASGGVRPDAAGVHLR